MVRDEFRSEGLSRGLLKMEGPMKNIRGCRGLGNGQLPGLGRELYH